MVPFSNFRLLKKAWRKFENGPAAILYDRWHRIRETGVAVRRPDRKTGRFTSVRSFTNGAHYSQDANERKPRNTLAPKAWPRLGQDPAKKLGYGFGRTRLTEEYASKTGGDVYLRQMDKEATAGYAKSISKPCIHGLPCCVLPCV
jgi:hypothetical protein